MRPRSLFLIVVIGCATVLVAAANPVDAQGASQNASNPAAQNASRGAAQSVLPPTRIVPGMRVQFADPWPDGATVQGRVTRRWADSIAVHPDGDLSPVGYRFADLREISVSDGRTVSSGNVGRGALYGAVGGAAIGAVLFSFMHHVESSDKHPKGRTLEIGISTAFGMITGAIGGALHTPERWHAVSPQ